MSSCRTVGFSDQRRLGRLSRQRNAWNGTGCRRLDGRLQVGQPQWLPTLGQQFLQLCPGGRAGNPTNFVPLHEQHVTGNTGHVEPFDEVVFLIDIDMSHQPAGCADLTDERCHLPARAAPLS